MIGIIGGRTIRFMTGKKSVQPPMTGPKAILHAGHHRTAERPTNGNFINPVSQSFGNRKTMDTLDATHWAHHAET